MKFEVTALTKKIAVLLHIMSYSVVDTHWSCGWGSTFSWNFGNCVQTMWHYILEKSNLQNKLQLKFTWGTCTHLVASYSIVHDLWQTVMRSSSIGLQLYI